MLRRDLFRRMLAAPLAAWLRNVPCPAHDEKPNAADVYRKVFGWGEDSPSEDWDNLRNPETVSIDGKRVAALLEKAREPIRALREAAKIEDCRWGPDPEKVDEYFQGRLNTANGYLVGAACLSARRHAKAGRGREAIDDLFAALTFARRVGTGGALIARLYETGWQIRTIRTIGRIVPDLDRPALDELERRLVALPKLEPLSATISGPERRFIVMSTREGLAKVGPSVEGKEWEELGFDDATAEALWRLTGGDRAKLLAHLDASAPAFAELGRLLDLPREEGTKGLERFAKDNAATFPVAASLVDAASSARNGPERAGLIQAMCLAAIVLVRDGEAAFRSVSDPFGKGPFGLERKTKGFIVRSALKREGFEAKLDVGDANV